MREAFARKALLYDRAGEEHFNIISALHKSVRNSDADAGLYWLARMLEAGEDPLYIARRLVRFASEDVGLADPQALVAGHGGAAGRALHRDARGRAGPGRARRLPGRRAQEQRGLHGLRRGRRRTPSRPGPSPCRFGSANAPTGLMKDLGYGKGYRYAHDEAEGVVGHGLPARVLAGRRYYHPTSRGNEATLAARLEAARLVRSASALRGREPE